MGNPVEASLKSKFSGNELREKLAETRLGYRENAIQRELFIEDAEASGYVVPQKELDDRVDFGVKGFHGDKAAFVQNLQKNGLTLEKFNERNRGDLLWSHEWGLHVYEPSDLFVKSAPGWDSMTAEEKQKLYTDETTKLVNELTARLEAKAVIQRFDDQLGIAAILDGQVITGSEVEQQVAETDKWLRQNHSGDELQKKLIEARKNVLHALIDRRLIIENFKKLGGFIPKSYIDERIDEIIKEQYGGDRPAFHKALAERGVSEENYRKEIEENAIVGYSRSKFVADKVWDFYQAHADQFSQDEQVSVTALEILGKQVVPTGRTGNFAVENNPEADEARRELQQLRAGADPATFPTLPGGFDRRFVGKPIWVTGQDPYASVPGYWPFKWSDIEKMKPGETSGIVVTDYAYSQGDAPNENRHAYWILRVNARRPAAVATTAKSAEQEQFLLDDQEKQIQEAWLAPLRAQAKVHFFDPQLAIDPWATEPARAMPVNHPGPGAFEAPGTRPKPENFTGAPTVLHEDVPSSASVEKLPVDNPLQQIYISDQMTWLTGRLRLSPAQAEALHAAMEATVRGTATNTVDQALKELLSPQQEAAWEEVKQGARLSQAGQSASFETERIKKLCGLTNAQQAQVFDVLYAIELKYPDWYHSTAEMVGRMDEKAAALAKILTPGQVLIYELQAKQQYGQKRDGSDPARQSMGVARLDATNPPVLKNFTPAPPPLPLNRLPEANLSLAMPNLQASNLAPDGGTYSGGTTVVQPGGVK